MFTAHARQPHVLGGVVFSVVTAAATAAAEVNATRAISLHGTAHAPAEVVRHEAVDDGVGCALDVGQQIHHQLQQTIEKINLSLSALIQAVCKLHDYVIVSAIQHTI